MTFSGRILRRATASAAAILLAAGAPAAHAARLWHWQFGDADGLQAAGTFTTVDAPDAAGFYLITAITGERDGVAITGLQPTGTAIPGNEPYAVDDLVAATGPQLTGNGFGFTTADGNASNPFWADFDSPPDYLEFRSFGPDGATFTERPVSFSATLEPVPEPAPLALLAAGAGLLALRRRRA
jgi:hypothetical protein